MSNAYLNSLTDVRPSDLEVALLELNFPPTSCAKIYEKIYDIQRATGAKTVVARDLVPAENKMFETGRWLYYGDLFGELTDACLERVGADQEETLNVVVDGKIYTLDPEWKVRIFHLPLKPKEA